MRERPSGVSDAAAVFHTPSGRFAATVEIAPALGVHDLDALGGHGDGHDGVCGAVQNVGHPFVRAGVREHRGPERGSGRRGGVTAAHVKRVAIAVAPNGGRKTKANHPGLPMTAEDLARVAAECLQVGASLIHLHVRDADGALSLAPRRIGRRPPRS